MNGFYAIYFTGVTGSSGFGVIAMKDGVIVGADAVGGQIDGSYTVGDQEIEGRLTVRLPPGAMSITGHAAGPEGLAMDFPSLRLPKNLGAGQTVSLQTPYGPINVNIRKLREFA